MKCFFVFFLCAWTFISCNTKESRDAKIKKSIYQNVSKGLDRNAMQIIDSVVILRVDSITAKAKFFMLTDRQKEWIEGERKIRKIYLESFHRHKEDLNFAKKFGLNQDIYIEWIFEDSIKISKSSLAIEKYERELDSLHGLHVTADGVNHWGYDVLANVYYTFNRETDTMLFSGFMNSKYILDDTNNKLIKELTWLGELKRIDIN